MFEFDLLMDVRHSVLEEAFWSELVKFIQVTKPFCVLATPPCSTYSRARHYYKQSPGPRPIRSRQHPLGFPWLSDKNLRKADEGAELANKSWELLDVSLKQGSHILSEFPEDLGATNTGVPASFWQMQQFQDILAVDGVHTFAIFQCEFGAATPKPTRFVSSLRNFQGPMHSGVPRFDTLWRYQGPLPPACPHPGQHDSLIGTHPDGGWKTSPAAHYPGPLCKFLADAIVHTWLESFASKGDDSRNKVEMDTGELKGPQISSHQPPIIDSGCLGPPLKASHAGRCEEFCDGLGLCSPGRWHPKLRASQKTQQQWDMCARLRDMLDRFCVQQIPDMSRATFELALGRRKSSIFDPEALRQLRKDWFNMLPDPRQASVCEKDQPFFLHALAQSLREIGDPDVDIIDTDPTSCFASGVHLGHLVPLGPTPQVFRPKLKETVYDDSEWQPEMDNYFSGSEAEAERILEQQFSEEEAAGRMVPISLAEARKQYPGDSLRIAAQGILEKPDGTYRVVHDGTHGVQLNNVIRVLDKMDNPGPREMACIMDTSIAADERVVFAVNADISKAHRRVRVRREDWGVQAARTSKRSDTIWLNKVGTFGVASAAFWWARLMGLIGRLTLGVSLRDWLFILTFVDDLHIAVGGPHRWLTFWRVLACLEMVGVPFSYHKFTGGFQLDYVGFWMDYCRFEIGMSDKRTSWLVKFVDELESNGWLVSVRRFQEFHGRLGFASQILPWIRPLLAPGYSWLAAVGKASTLKLPDLVSVVCLYIRDKLKSGLRKSRCGVAELDIGEVFRTDAKCEDGRVVVGGWSLADGVDTKKARWFSLEINPIQAPWLFQGENLSSSWASTAAELLAALIALKVFGVGSGLPPGSHFQVLRCTGGVDNKATDALTSKKLSTKLPVMIILIEYLNHCEKVGLRCQLDWRPRETNVAADDLTNGRFDKFSAGLRVQTIWEDLRFPMIDLLMGFVDSFKKRRSDALTPFTGGDKKFRKSSWG
eukprot:Skav226142  [mRNA]  locus=scaffold1047:606146:609121:- [translate_table: standard]